MEQENQEVQEDLGTGGKFKNWLQDNIRIIISVLIVVAIAGGIYSYSNRGEDSISEEDIAIEEIDDEAEEDSDDEMAVVTDEEEDETEVTEEDTTPDVIAEEEIAVIEEVKQEEEDVKIIDSAEEVIETISEETGESFIVTAAPGDSVTTLSRQALRDYLEKNNDSSLTAEHKIYIEDYLRKNVNHTGGLTVGGEISFSKSLIQNAIEKSKTLNENQLENLKKYSSRVSGL